MGSGSIFLRERRSHGKLERRWVASMRMPDGSRPTTACSHPHAKSERHPCEQARANLETLRRIKEGQAPSDIRTLTVGSFLQTWANSLEHGWAPATKRQHAMIVRVHLEPAFRHRLLTQLTPSDVDQYLAWKGSHGRAGLVSSRVEHRVADGRGIRALDPQTLRHHRATLRLALNHAIRDGYIDRNPAALAHPPRMHKAERRYLTAGEVTRLIETSREDRLWPLWTLLVTTGLRLSEALGLSWADVDFGVSDARDSTTPGTYAPRPTRDPNGGDGEASGSGGRVGELRHVAHPQIGGADRRPRSPTLTVRRKLLRVNGEWATDTPKTPKSRRTISLIPRAVEALTIQWQQQLEERYGAETSAHQAPQLDAGERMPANHMRARNAPGSVGSMVEGAGRRKPSGPVSRGLNNSPSLVAQQEPWRQRIDQEQHGLDRGDAPTADAPARTNVRPLTPGLVFTTQSGLPIHGTNVLPPFRRALRRAGLPVVTLHDLRHSFATYAHAAGVPLPVIAQILGHSSIRVTADLYAHITPQLHEDAARRISEALSG